MIILEISHELIIWQQVILLCTSQSSLINTLPIFMTIRVPSNIVI